MLYTSKNSGPCRLYHSFKCTDIYLKVNQHLKLGWLLTKYIFAHPWSKFSCPITPAMCFGCTPEQFLDTRSQYNKTWHEYVHTRPVSFLHMPPAITEKTKLLIRLSLCGIWLWNKPCEKWAVLIHSAHTHVNENMQRNMPSYYAYLVSLFKTMKKPPRASKTLCSSPRATITKKGEFGLVKTDKISSAIRSGSFMA